MLLIGYEDCLGNGFKLPIFKETENSNAIYTAICSHEGALPAEIEDFLPLEIDSFSVNFFPPREEVQRGSAWVDVFISSGEVISGDYCKIWHALKKRLNHFSAESALSTFEAASRFGAEEAPMLASLSLQRVSKALRSTKTMFELDSKGRAKPLSDEKQREVETYHAKVLNSWARAMFEVAVADTIHRLPAELKAVILKDLVVRFETVALSDSSSVEIILPYLPDIDLNALMYGGLTQLRNISGVMGLGPVSLNQEILKSGGTIELSSPALRGNKTVRIKKLEGNLPGSVLFCCDHNTLFSPLAEGILKSAAGDRIYVDSAGVSSEHKIDELMVSVAAEIEVDVSRHRVKSLDEMESMGDDITAFDVIIALTPGAQRRALEYTRDTGLEVQYWPQFDPRNMGFDRSEEMQFYRRTRDFLMENIESKLQVY